jgi:hypothetical protein
VLGLCANSNSIAPQKATPLFHGIFRDGNGVHLTSIFEENNEIVLSGSFSGRARTNGQVSFGHVSVESSVGEFQVFASIGKISADLEGLRSTRVFFHRIAMPPGDLIVILDPVFQVPAILEKVPDIVFVMDELTIPVIRHLVEAARRAFELGFRVKSIHSPLP